MKRALITLNFQHLYYVRKNLVLLNKQLKISVISKVVGENLIMTFKDNGIGIDLVRNRDKVFGLYQRFHNYPDSKGLGLYLVKSQVETMGGTITIDSEVNKGTTFTIIFKNN